MVSENASAASASSSAASAATSTSEASDSAASAAASASSATASAGSATAAASSATDAATAETGAEDALAEFETQYLGSSATAPTGSILTGALYFNTVSNTMFVYTGSSWAAAGSAVNGTAERQEYVATSGQTNFSATYDVGFVDVYLNGSKLIPTTDFTATNGATVILNTGAVTGDNVSIIAYGAFNVADVYTQAQSDARYAQFASPTFTGTVTADGLSLGDNDKATFGNSNDLEIYHNASNSYIDDVGTGNLFVRANNLRLSNADNSQYYLIADNSGFVKLNYSGSQKLATTATGIDVTGTATMDGLTVNGTVAATNLQETVYALTGTALDAGNGGIQTKTLAANTTFTDSLTSGDAIVLQLEAGASYTVTWPTMTWVTSGGNVAPTLTAKDTLVFWKVSSVLYGAYTGSYV